MGLKTLLNDIIEEITNIGITKYNVKPNNTYNYWNQTYLYYDSFTIKVGIEKNRVYLSIDMTDKLNKIEKYEEFVREIKQSVIDKTERKFGWALFSYSNNLENSYSDINDRLIYVKGKKNLMPINKESEEIANMLKLISEKFYSKYGNSYLQINGGKYNKSYGINCFKDKLGFKIVLYTGDKEIKVLRSEEEILEFEKEAIENRKFIENYIGKITNIIKKYDKNSIYNKEKEEVIVFNRKYPLYSEKTLEDVYKINIFSRKISSKDWNKFTSKVEEHVKNYLIKNRLTHTIQNGVMNDVQKFYYKVTDKKTTKNLFKIKKEIKTQLNDEKIKLLITNIANEEVTQINDEKKLDEYKKLFNFRGHLKKALIIDENIILTSKSKIYIAEK